MNGDHGVLEQVMTAMGIAVLHSLWQCALVGMLSALLMLVLRRANTRYIVWCVSMLVCMAWVVATFVGVMWPGASDGDVTGGLGIGSVFPVFIPVTVPAPNTITMEIIAWLWAGGFVYCIIRFAQQWGAARRMRTRGVVEAERCWLDLFAELRTELGVSHRVGMLVSTRARSPMVVGVLSPVVIVPMSALTMLSPEQMRLVLVHELAHIRRYDHVINMLQVLIETVLFYHPVVWWMSHQARLEREHCCDDAAVRWGGDAVAFARALTGLETTRTQSRAVLAINQGGSLMDRITRILGIHDRRRLGNGSLRTLAALTAGTVVAAAGIANAAMQADEPTEEKIELIRTNVESGVMTRAQAREIFDRMMYPGSELQLKVDAQLSELREEIDAAIETGRITVADGNNKLAEVEAKVQERLDYHFHMSVLGMTKSESRLSVLADQLAAKVAHGWLTQADAEDIYRRAEREIGMNTRIEEHLEKVAFEIRAAVEAGELTGEEGKERMAAAKQGVEMRLKWVSIERQIEAAVESGAITRAEADEKYRVLEAEFARFKDNGGRSGDFDWEAFKERTEQGIESDAPGGKPSQIETQVEPIGKGGKLTPMDEAYFLHQGIRALSEYDESFDDDC